MLGLQHRLRARNSLFDLVHDENLHQSLKKSSPLETSESEGNDEEEDEDRDQDRDEPELKFKPEELPPLPNSPLSRTHSHSSDSLYQLPSPTYTMPAVSLSEVCIPINFSERQN